MMAPNANNHLDPSYAFQPKMTHHPTSINRGKPSTPQTQSQRVAPSLVTSRVDDYPPDSADTLKMFNESLQQGDRQGSHLSTMSDVTLEFGCNLNEDWTNVPHQKPFTAKRDETDHLATIINLKMELAQAHAKNDQLALLLRQCMAEKMDIECKMRASLRSSNMQTQSEPAHNHRHSFHAPPSYQPTKHVHRTNSMEHAPSTHKPRVWHEEVLCTSARQNKIDYVGKLMSQQFRDGGTRVVRHK